MTLAPNVLDVAAVRQLVASPVAYSRGVLGNTVYPPQREILRCVQDYNQVAVRSGHGLGKTHTAASAALWWLTRYPLDGKVVTIAPRAEQVKTIMWPEIRGQYNASPLARELLGNVKCHQTHLEVSDQCFAEGTTAGEESALQGYHGTHLLLIADEAPGVQYGFFEVLEGARATGHVTLLMLGNPTLTGGPFHEAFTKPELGYQTIHLSAFGSPNITSIDGDLPPGYADELDAPGVDEVVDRRRLHYLLERQDEGDEDYLDANVFPHLMTRRYVAEHWTRWGKPGHPYWHSRVLGEFAPQSEDALISGEWLLHASRTWPIDTGKPIFWGVDVAGPGKDETVLLGLQDGQIVHLQTWAGLDARVAVINAIRPHLSRTLAVNVDSAGIGYYFALELAEDIRSQHAHVMVTGVNVGMAAHDKYYRNLKAMVFWNLREVFQRGEIGSVSDPVLVEQLQSLRWRMNPKGQIEMETKEEMSKRGLPSPDRADALALASWPAESYAAQAYGVV